jgi:hypothetical protein
MNVRFRAALQKPAPTHLAFWLVNVNNKPDSGPLRLFSSKDIDA